MSTRMILAALIGAVVSFFLGWLVFGTLLDPYYQSNMVHYNGLVRGEDDMRFYAIFLAQLCWSGLVAYIFDKWANIRTFQKGLMGGIIIFALAYAGFDLMMYASMNLFGYKMMIVDVLVNAVFGGLISGVIAVVLGWGNRKSA